jgi:hypothetical protein
VNPTLPAAPHPHGRRIPDRRRHVLSTVLPHDMVDPDQPAGDPALVYPLLMDLLAQGTTKG